MFAFVSIPLDTCLISHRPLLPACSLGDNKLTNGGDMSGLLKLVEILPSTKIKSLGCAAASKCLLLCQHPLTRLVSHCPDLSHALQSLAQRHRRQGRLRARCRPQGDADHHLPVRRRPRVFAFVSAPIDTHLLSHCPHPTPGQSLPEQHRARGWLRARCCSQGDADHQLECAAASE